MGILDWIQPGDKVKTVAMTKAEELAAKYGLKFPKRHGLEPDPATPAPTPAAVTPMNLIQKFQALDTPKKLAIIGGGAGSLVLVLWLINRK